MFYHILVAAGRCDPDHSRTAASPRCRASFTSGRFSLPHSAFLPLSVLSSAPGRSAAALQTPRIPGPLRRRLVPPSPSPTPEDPLQPSLRLFPPHNQRLMTRATPMVVHGAERSPSVRHLRAEAAAAAAAASRANVS